MDPHDERSQCPSDKMAPGPSSIQFQDTTSTREAECRDRVPVQVPEQGEVMWRSDHHCWNWQHWLPIYTRLHLPDSWNNLLLPMFPLSEKQVHTRFWQHMDIKSHHTFPYSLSFGYHKHSHWYSFVFCFLFFCESVTVKSVDSSKTMVAVDDVVWPPSQ